MDYLWTTLMVSNLEKSIEFYSTLLGWEIKRRFKNAEGWEIAFLGNDGTEIELICNPSKKQIDSTKDISMGFDCGTIEEATKFLSKEKIDIIEGPISPNPSITFMYINDPDGHRIQLAERK